MTWAALANNRILQGVGAFLLFIIGYQLWKREVTEHVRKNERYRIYAELEKTSKKAVERVETRRRASDDLNARQLRDLAANSPHNRARVRDSGAD